MRWVITKVRCNPACSILPRRSFLSSTPNPFSSWWSRKPNVRSVFWRVPSVRAALAITHENLFLAVPHRNLSAATTCFFAVRRQRQGLSEERFAFNRRIRFWREYWEGGESCLVLLQMCGKLDLSYWAKCHFENGQSTVALSSVGQSSCLTVRLCSIVS